MPKKLVTKDLKQPDKLQVAFLDLLKFISKNRSKAYLISSIIFIILSLAGGYYLYRLNYEKKANLIFAKIFSSQIKVTPTSNKDFNPLDIYNEVSSKYPNSQASLLAYYRVGNMFFERGDIDKAINSYNEFLKRSSEDNDIKTLTYTGLGYCYEAKKDYKNALISFEKALATKEGKNFAGMTNRNIARIYEQMNEREKALEYYKKALTNTTDTSVQLLLKRKIATLG